MYHIDMLHQDSHLGLSSLYLPTYLPTYLSRRDVRASTSPTCPFSPPPLLTSHLKPHQPFLSNELCTPSCTARLSLRTPPFLHFTPFTHLHPPSTPTPADLSHHAPSCISLSPLPVAFVYD
ncbi:hypothetical protein K523DRAFT_78588 [Schizophyllum commune Tattone D]|nr:hypothetical protein K523DRAFT_78588 [Schizophyllum commune Tattone D]